MLQAERVGAAQGRYLPLVGRGSICMLMPVRHPAAWLAGIIWRPRLATICIHAAASTAFTAAMLDSVVRSSCLVGQHHLRHLTASLLNQHMLILESPNIEQCLVVLLIILMLKGIGVMMKGPDAGGVASKNSGRRTNFCFPQN